MKQISKKHSTKIDYQGNIVYAKTVSISSFFNYNAYNLLPKN